LDFTPQGNGLYVVTLTTTDAGGRAGSVSYTIDVTPVVVLSPIVTPPSQGQLDPTFGTGGIQIGTLGSPDDEAIDTFAQPDGKLLVVGLTQDLPNGGYSVTISRYEANGSLDTAYGSAGTVITDLTSPNYFFPLPANQFVCQPDGSLVVLWMTKDAGGNVLSTQLARYRSDGSQDTAFGSIATAAISGFSATVIAGQIDGKILIGGNAVVGTDVNGNPVVDSVVERLNADGSQDTSFGAAGTGEVIQDLGLHKEVALGSAYTLDQSYVRCLAVQPDGTVLVGGYANDPTRSFLGILSQPFVARFRADGSQDTSFGTGGEVVLVNENVEYPVQNLGPSAVGFNTNGWNWLGAITTTITLEPNGQFLVGMTVQPYGGGNPNQVVVFRLNSGGTLNYDSGLGDGLYVPPTLLLSSAAQWTVDAGGKILVFDPIHPPLDAGGNHEFAVTRYKSRRASALWQVGPNATPPGTAGPATGRATTRPPPRPRPTPTPARTAPPGRRRSRPGRRGHG
jgi:uncharacterized delta-60 repeat protein